MADRIYQKQNNSRFRQMISSADLAAQPVYIVKPETTGLVPGEDRICAMLVLRCYFLDHQLCLDGKFQTLVKTDVPMSKEMTALTGITQEMVDKKGIPEKEMLIKLRDFLGKNPTLCGFGTVDFIKPFLADAVMRNGVQINIKAVFDIRTMARSVLAPQKNMEDLGYSARALAKRCGTEYSPQGFIDIFNSLYERLPFGLQSVKDGFIKGTEYWSKGYNTSFIYFKTKCGKVALNCRTLYFEECMRGFFDVINMDSFSDYVVQKTKSKNMSEVAKKLSGKNT